MPISTLKLKYQTYYDRIVADLYKAQSMKYFLFQEISFGSDNKIKMGLPLGNIWRLLNPCFASI